MAITRITAEWGGFRGAPGYSNFFFDGEFVDPAGIEAAAVAVRTFFNDVSDEFPDDMTIAIQGTADVLDEATGQVTNSTDFTPPSSTSGSDVSGYAAAVGGVVNWNTNDYVNGRRVRGRTFLVPLGNSAFAGSGAFTQSTLDALRAAASGLVSTTLDHPLCVWRRPTNGAGGSSHVVTGSTVPNLGAVLRSRRD